jgi:hypothetical protein
MNQLDKRLIGSLGSLRGCKPARSRTLFLVSPASDMTTGQIIAIDAGR